MKENESVQFYSKKEESSHERENATQGSYAIIQHSASVAGQDNREAALSLCRLCRSVYLGYRVV